MFRKTASTLFGVSKFVVSRSLKTSSAVSTQINHLATYQEPNRSNLTKTEAVSSDAHRQYLQLLNKGAVAESASLTKAIAERTAKLRALRAEYNKLEVDNANDKERLLSTSLYTNEKAESIVARSSEFEEALLASFKHAVLNKKRYCELPYISGHHLNFLQTVLDEFQIKLIIAEFDHPVRLDASATWCEILLPEDLQVSTSRCAIDNHPVYAAWLDQFRDKLNNIIKLINVEEYEPNRRPTL